MSLGLPANGYIATEESVEETLQNPTTLLEIVKVVHRLLVEDTERDRPIIRKVVESGIVPKIVEFLTWDESPDLQIEVARVITEVAMGPPEQTEAVAVESGAIPPLGGLIIGSFRHDDVRKHAALALGNSALCSPLCRDLVLEAGAAGPIVELLSEEVVLASHNNNNNNNRPLLRRTAWALACICSDGPDFDRVRPALPVLEKLLHHPDRKVVEEACWTFDDLMFSFDDDIVQAVLDAGPAVATRLAELLGSPRPRLQLYVLTKC
jgi:importin subunit alpha-6/7